ncbi:MAG: hypothetical protein AB1641_28380 [Thermodesulfobacteriota bacterium]
MGGMMGMIILLVFSFPVLLVVGFFLIWALKVAKGEKGEMPAEETKLIQELHQGLQRMEERIEALETILLDQEKSARGREDSK